MANLSNINNKFLVTTGGNVLIGQTSAVGTPIFQVAGNSRFSGEIRTANRLAIKETVFGYSSSYKVIQVGESAATKAISLGYDPSGNTSGSFSGNEILIPNNIRILAPAANNSGYYGLMMLNSSNKVLLGASNYLMESNYIMSLDTATKNVGIGTTSPSSKLHIDQPSNDRAGGLYIERNGSNYGLSAFVNSGGYGVIGSNGDFTTDVLTMNLSNGNVGIGGIDTPHSPLQVKGSVNNLVAHFGGQNNTNGQWNGISLGYAEASNSAYRKVGIAAKAIGDGAARQELHFLVNSNADSNSAGIGDTKMMINTSGNVGIGTTNPSGIKFQTVQTTSGEWTGGFKNYTSNGYGLRVDMSGSSSPQAALQVYTGSGTGFVVKNSGNVGIGTFTPTGYKLVIQNTSEDMLKLHNSTDGLDSLISFTNPGGTLGRIQGLDNGGLQFDTGNNAGGLNTDVMVMSSGGNVGIGTNTEFPLTITKNTTSGLNSGVMLSFNGVGAYSTGYRFLSEANGSAEYLQVLFDGDALKWKQWNGSSYAEKMVLYDGGRLHPTGGVFLGSSNNSNLLNDYEEGTWTPLIKDLFGNQASTSTALGTYRKIGSQLIVNYDVRLSSKGSMTGNYVLLGLPFTHAGSTCGTGTIDKFNNMTTAFSSMAWDTTSTNTVAWLVGVEGTSATNSVYVTVAEISDTTKFKGTIIYHQ